MMAHVIRKRGLLPACVARRDALNKHRSRRRGAFHSLKYLTIADEHALDVALLYAKAILPHERNDFSTVVFFASDQQAAISVPSVYRNVITAGDAFIQTVLAAENSPPAPASGASSEELAIWQRLVNLAGSRKQFHAWFPFDVVNLDLTGPREASAGAAETLLALSTIFSWQANPEHGVRIDEFTLSLTVPVWKPAHAASVSNRFASAIEENLRLHDELQPMFEGRTQAQDWESAATTAWTIAFQLAFPKALLRLLHDAGWEITQHRGPVFIERVTGPGNDPDAITIVVDVVKSSGTSWEQASSEFAYHCAIQTLFGEEYSSVSTSDCDISVSREINRLKRQVLHLIADRL